MGPFSWATLWDIPKAIWTILERVSISNKSSLCDISSLKFISLLVTTLSTASTRPIFLFLPDYHKLALPPIIELILVQTSDEGLPFIYFAQS